MRTENNMEEGAMSDKWRTVRLTDICRDVRYGYTARTTKTPSGVKFVRVTDISSGTIDWSTVPYCTISDEDFARYKLMVGDIVIARMGTIGQSAIIKDPLSAVAASYLVIHRIDPYIADPLFVSYVLRSPFWWNFIWSHGSSGAVQPNINAKTMGEFTFLLPPLYEQRAIAYILGTLDDKIELNRRMSETLEQMARALFKAWFVDFEPVRAKMEGRWKRGQSLLGLPAHLYDLFPDRLVNSELGEIPDGWSYLTFEKMVIAKQGKFLANGEMLEYPIDDFIYPVWGGNGIRGYTREKMYDHPIVVLTCRGSNCGLIHKTDSASWISNIAFGCEPKIGSINFIYVYFKHCSFIDCISGSAQPQITYDILRNKQMPYPISSEVCELYSKIIDPLFQKISMNNHESRTLAALRDALLPKLISGELRVKDAERFLKERGL